jgi:hypothetical protein
MMLRRTTPDTVRAMKRLRDRLFPQPPWLGGTASTAVIERLRDPAVIARIDGFRSAGTLW